MKLRILIVDDHPLILYATCEVLQRQYPEAEIITNETAQDALKHVQSSQLDLAVIDLSIPQAPGMIPRIDTGIQLLKKLMKNYPNLNIVVQSSYVKALVRIKNDIDEHQGGFTIADKGLSTKERLARVNLALQGGTYTKDLGRRVEVHPEWLEVLKLAFEEGLQDKAIAERMNVAERTVRHYWLKLQDVLDIYAEDSKQEGKNIRIETQIRAREKGLID